MSLPAKAPAARGERRRLELIRIAEDVFLERGYADATMDEVAQRAGASKATLYKFFGTKEGLFAASVHQHVPTLMPGPEDDPDGHVYDRLIAWGHAVIAMIATPRSVALYRVIVSEVKRAPELGQLFYNSGPAEAERAVAELIRQGVEHGELTCDDPRELAVTFVSMVLGNWLRMALVGILTPRPGNDQVKRAVDMLFARYGTGSRPVADMGERPCR